MVFNEIDSDKAKSHRGRTAEIYLGDYIDRGPESASVISKLISRSRDAYTIFLRGNHEQMLLDFIAGEPCLDVWKTFGAIPTLLSYGIPRSILSHQWPQEEVRGEIVSRLPGDHYQFLANTAAYCETERYLFVHADVRPGIKLESQTREDILGIRDAFLDFDGDYGWIVVHGHTPVLAPDFRSNRINIDTGAYVTNYLTCIRIGENGPHVLNSRLSP